jgi:hypothetical protein
VRSSTIAPSRVRIATRSGSTSTADIQAGKATPDATTGELKGAKLRYAVL